MNRETPQGLRVFLLTLLELVSNGEKVSCEEIENALAEGVASMLYKNYKQYFEDNGFDVNNKSKIDEYYKQWDGCADGKELSKYACKEDDGLALLIALALNKIN